MQLETGHYDFVLADRGLPDSPGEETPERLQGFGAVVIPMSGGMYEDTDTIEKTPEAILDAIEKWGARMPQDATTDERRLVESRRIVGESEVLADIRDALVYLKEHDQRQMDRVERWQRRRTECVEGFSRAAQGFLFNRWEGRMLLLVLGISLATWLAGPAVLEPVLARAWPVDVRPMPSPAPLSHANGEPEPRPLGD